MTTAARKCLDDVDLRVTVEGMVDKIAQGESVGVIMIFTSKASDGFYDTHMQTNVTDRSLLAHVLHGALEKVESGPADRTLEPLRKN